MARWWHAARRRGVLAQSGIRFQAHAARRSGQQHTVMSKADDFDDAILASPINDDLPRIAHARFRIDEAAAETKRKNADAGDPRDGPRTRCVRGCTQGGEYGEHQQVVAFRGWHTPFSSAFEQDAVDIGAREEPIGQSPWASRDIRARSRDIALTGKRIRTSSNLTNIGKTLSSSRVGRPVGAELAWRASLSSGPATVTNRPEAMSASARP
jgi:hypothetical protein